MTHENAEPHRYPRGWFVVALSDEIETGKAQSVTYFGRRMVVFRGDDGQVRVTDAYCPHLGADLGVGGKVEGCEIRCPFHAWKFSGDTGQCTEVPYAKRIPAKAKIGTYLVDEVNGLIFIWNDPEGGEPDFRIPKLTEWDDPTWNRWKPTRIEIKTHPREIVENVADKGHFQPVHGTHIDNFENHYEGHTAVQIIEGVAYPRGGGKDKFRSVTTYYGPAYQTSEMDGYLPNKIVNCHTPIGPNLLHLWFGVMLQVKPGADKKQTEAFQEGYANNLLVGFKEDIAIWENKVFRERPILCDGDGDLGGLRRWYKQFYEDRRPASPPAAE
jgi:3-ketosteroid 9alpha-monooxygenase subunit A